jgi:hypothetical protein
VGKMEILLKNRRNRKIKAIYERLEAIAIEGRGAFQGRKAP